MSRNKVVPTEVDDEALILGEIQDKYVPFLKKLIAFLEKNQKVTPDNLNRLKSIYTVFTTSSISEQIDTFKANKKKLEKWYKNPKKDTGNEDPSDNSSAQGQKRSLVIEDTDSGDNSQGASDAAAPANKRGRPSDPNAAEATVFSPAVALQIKKERVEGAQVAAPAPQASASTVAASAPVVAASASAVAAPVADDDNSMMFSCASCQFQSEDDQEFMKHTRTDHRSDLSMWCKRCGRCFSNAGVLVGHIRTQSCSKEDMIYKCGVKECTFETTSGQTFVHHLRHCHKGSPFIFCVHCQKIFTLPHCLILHMQDECPFKERNRRNPGSPAPPAEPAPPAPTPVVQRPSTVSFSAATPTIASVSSYVSQPTPATPVVHGGLTPRGGLGGGRGGGLVPSSRGTPRGRGRGRGRSRGRPISDEDTDSDADDPSWKPEELPENSNLRRSGRFAKKVNDAVTVAPKSTSKGLTSEDLRNAKEMIRCPCCDYLAAFQSVLHDHFIAQHKIPNKNGCTECLLKFESTESFIEHFKYHKDGKLPKIPSAVDNGVAVTNNVEKVAAAAAVTINTVQVVRKAPEESPMSPAPKKAAFDEELMQEVVRNISEANVIDPTSEDAQCIKIPYQAAIHDKGSKDGKQTKLFEEMKAPNDLVEMKKSEKLKHFYKCAVYRCTFTSHDDSAFVQHVKKMHDSKMIRCNYCLKEYFSAEILVQHMMAEHSKRTFQCSSCFYRACSTKHLKTHIQHYHTKDVGTVIVECDPVRLAGDVVVKGEPTENTTWPYICAIGECVFQSFDPKQFRIHNETVHRTVSVFFCHYCKVDFISFHRLLDHHRLHGINALQCNYCIHGSETREDILLHLCNAHADFPMKAFKRGLEADDVPQSGDSSLHPNSEMANPNDMSIDDSPICESPPVEAIEKNQTDFEEFLYEVVGETYYPKYLKSMATDFLCGVQFCREKFDSLLSYIGHLCNHHAAVNFPCPHCPQVSEDWKSFKNHLMCHGPDLFACGLVTCSFYDWNKQAVTDHLKSHTQSKAKVVIVREEESEDDDIDKVMSLPQSYSGKISKDPSYQCLYCRYKCTDKNMMKNHLYEEVMYKRFCCSSCNAKHVSRRDIKNHFLEKHANQDIKCSVHPDPAIENAVQKFLNLNIIPEETKAGRCGKCKKNFKAGFHLQQHMYLCTRKQYQPFDCNYCKSSFHDLKLLKFHVDEKHFRTPLAYTEVSSQLVEEALIPKLQQIRLELLKEALSGQENGPSDDNVPLTKHYGCSECKFESNHKHNTQLHIENTHKGEAQVTKTLRNMNMPDLPNSKDNAKEEAATGAKPYRCGFCIKRLQSLEELEKHVEATHSVRDEPKYSYYYSPLDTTSDTNKYECSYCKSGSDTLAALRKHSQLMHAESPFRVRGYVHRDQDWAPVACAYCYQRVNDAADLKRHSTTEHQGLPQKSVGGFAPRGQKRAKPGDDTDSEDHTVNKRVRFSSSVFICTHCGAAFSLRGQVTAHSKKAHARLQTKFTEEAEGDRTFLQCEFCTFTGEQPSLDRHLATKHRNRVTCGHCTRRFEFASRLKEHHDTAHPDLPVRYSQETFADAPPPLKVSRTATSARSPAKMRNVAEPSKTNASTKKNLSKIMVNTSGLAVPEKKMSLAAFEEAYDIQPKVLLMRCNVPTS